MATSIGNRQFTPHELVGFPTIAGPFEPGPTKQLLHSLDLSFPNKPETGNYRVVNDTSSDDDDEDEVDNNQYHLSITKAKDELEPSVLDSRDEFTVDNWIERHPSLLRLTGKHPFNAEPPVPRLMQHGFITPVPLQYVRNHGPVPKAVWDDWTVEVTGLVKNPMHITMHQLVTEFPSKEFPVTLVCASNRRKEQNMVKQSLGFNWGPAAVSNSLYRGVPLSSILKRCGIMSKKSGAVYVCFEGAEDLPGGGGGGSKYGTSLMREIAMDPTRDIILAYMQNGERLAPDHGFPVRLVIPGFSGARMVKWLKRIVVSPAESDSYYHYRDNKLFPTHLVDAELANAEAWWYKPECIINELNINSIITTPSHDEILSINSFTTHRPYTLKGFAYSGGGKKVIRVEVTLNGGETWLLCALDRSEKPNKYGRYWCWCFWSLEVDVLDLLSANEIAVRAWDETFNTQPDKLIWNLMGMMTNSWFRVKTNVWKPHNGETGIVFEHPTQPGNNSGGWMSKERHLQNSSTENQPLHKSISSPILTTTSKKFSVSEVKKHNSVDSAWIIIHDQVYDCTSYLKEHPGGADSILINAGSDCTEEFEAIHSDKAKNILEDYRIGELIKTGYESSPINSVHGPSSISLYPINEIASAMPPTEAVRNVALVQHEKISCKLVAKTSISSDVRLFRFALPSEEVTLGLPVGKHIFIYATINEKLCMRAYTPSSGVDAVGYFELVVKIYFKGSHPKFPNGGLMSQYLDSMQLGSFIDVKGPLGHIEYVGKGYFSVHGKQKFARKLAMIAGGTGITPIYQVMQAILKDPEDDTEMYVVYANRTEDDILLKDKLDRWAEENSDRVKVWYVVQETAKEDWKYSVGFITESVLREHLPEPSKYTLALACGPPPMLQFAVNPNLEKMGYDLNESLLLF